MKSVTDLTSGRLTISEKDWTSLRTHLLQADGLERVSLMLLGKSASSLLPEYFVHRHLPIPDERCERQSAVIIEPDTMAVLDTFQVFVKSSAAVFCHAHSHPFSGIGRFSGGDQQYLAGHVRSLKNYLRTSNTDLCRQFLRIVLGRDESGFEAEVHDLDAARVCRIESIRIVGPSGIRTLPDMDGDGLNSSAKHLDRNLRWLGAAGQARIQNTRIAVCGLGGVGAEVVKNLRGLGFRRFVLIDHDRLEASNLNRLPYRSEDVGTFKVELAAHFIRELDPSAEIVCLPTKVQDSEAQRHLADCDLIVSGMDSDAARLSIQVLAARHLRPIIDVGSGIRLQSGTRTVSAMGGQLSVYTPGGPCLACQGLNTGAIEDESLAAVRESVGYVRGVKETPASVVTINAIMAGLASDAAMRMATGFSQAPGWLSCDLIHHKLHGMQFVKRESCPICGTDGVEGLGAEIDEPLPSPKTFVEEPLEPDDSSEVVTEECPADVAHNKAHEVLP